MIEISVDLTDTQQKLGAMSDQLPYAASRALNDVATGFQADERKGLQSRMTIRRDWVLQGIKINRGDFATKQKLEVTVRVDPARDFLTKFEQGGTKRPTSGKALSLPVTVRRTKAQIIQKAQRPRSFNFTQGFTSLKSRWTIYKGDRHTFMLQRPDGFGLILQRTRRGMQGPTRHGNRNMVKHRQWGHDPYLRTLWTLRPAAQIKPLLEFVPTAIASFKAQWVDAFKARLAEAMRTAK